MRAIPYILLPLLLVCGGQSSAQHTSADSLLLHLRPILHVLDSGASEAKNFTKQETDSLVNTAANLLVLILEQPLADTINFERYPAIPQVTRAKGGRAKIINIRYPGPAGTEFFAPVIQWRDEIGQNHASRLYDSCKYSMMDRLGESPNYITFCDTRYSQRGPLRKIEGMVVGGGTLQTKINLFADSIPVTIPIDYCGFFYNPETDSFHFDENECPDLHIISSRLGCNWQKASFRFNGHSFVAEKAE